MTWRFAILDTPSINAMAFPGGIVVITRGLYALLASEDELAAVLAHEIAHVNRRHQWKVIQQQKLVALAGNAVAKSDPGQTAAVVADHVLFGTCSAVAAAGATTTAVRGARTAGAT